jgi:hypothetical protein
LAATATTTNFVITPVRRIWIGLGLLLNAILAGGALFLCWVLGIRPVAAGLGMLAMFLSVAAWTAFNAIMIFGLALKRWPAFRVLIRPGHLEFETAQGNRILSPADIEKYICYNNRIVFRHPGGTGSSFRPFLRGRADETTLYTVMLSGGQASIRRQLAMFDPDFDSKQAYTLGSVAGQFVS